MSLQTSKIQEFIGTTASIEFQITTDPTRTAQKTFGSTLAPTSYSFLASALQVSGNGKRYQLRIPIRVIATDGNVLGLLPGQKIRANGSLLKSKELRVAALFVARQGFVVMTPPSKWAKSLGTVRTRLRELSRHDDAGALIPGMVLGDTSLQSADFKVAMRRSGLTHLVAVSGANFAIVSLFVLWCMQWIFRSMRARLIFTAIALICFIALVRPSPSVLRAAAMASVVLFAKGTGKKADPLPALGFAIAAVIIGDPWQGRDPGFALSVLATAGLLLLSPRISQWLEKYIPAPIAGALSPPIAAVVMCAPILIALSGYLGLMTVVANLLAAPMVAPITIVGFIAAIVAPFFPGFSTFLLFFIHFLAAWIAGVANWAARFPVLQLGKGMVGFLLGLLMIVVAIGFVYAVRSKRFVALGVTVLLLFGFVWVTRWPGGEWSIANCDVGQGDSMVINLGDHRGIVIDAGPDPQLEDRCLSQLGISTISLFVITHFHADHVEGIPGLLHNRKVEEVWVGIDHSPAEENSHVVKWLEGLPLHVAVKGSSTRVASDRGLIDIKVLWPEAGPVAEIPDYEDGTTINNSSVALDIRSPDFSLFAGGDIEPDSQMAVLPVQKTDLYKVSHHGSAYQSLELMKELSPQISFISVGLGNTYGHPSLETISALSKLGSKVYRTDKDGAIAILARDHKYFVRTSGGAWWKKVRLS
ncbi:MAG: ComEC/Rec2 family competence protein [Actinomycetota bacterium]